jgi:CHRD domain-containing protein/PEP-CTERM motif-containing protein
MLRSLIASLAAAAAISVAGAAHSSTFVYTDIMSGANEVPPTGSPATGTTMVTVDDGLDTLAVVVTFSGLVGGPAAAAHIHCCTPAGSNTIVAVPFTEFPNAASGTYSNTFDLTDASIYNPAFLTGAGGTAAGAESVLLAGLADGMAYSNIHDSEFPGGEIRGFLAPEATTGGIPEPATWAALALGFGLAGAALRRRRGMAVAA